MSLMPRVAALLLCVAALVTATDEIGTHFLAENAKKKGVVTLPTGLQYKILTSGVPSAPRPLEDTPCDCHYVGRLVDGTEFDSSVARGDPITLAPNQVIAGWTQAMQLMREGDKWELYIPSELGYGSRGSGSRIPPESALIFEMELIKVHVGKSSGIMSTLLSTMQGVVFTIPTQPPVKVRMWHCLALLVTLWILGALQSGSSSGKTVSASHILVKDRAECQRIKDEIAAKATPTPSAFQDAAKQYSQCPSGKQNGGSLGQFSPGSMVPAFDRVCFDPLTDVGVVQGPIETHFGYHLILVHDRSDPDIDKPKQS